MAWILVKALPEETIKAIKAVRETILSSIMTDQEDDEGEDEDDEDEDEDDLPPPFYDSAEEYENP